MRDVMVEPAGRNAGMRRCVEVGFVEVVRVCVGINIRRVFIRARAPLKKIVCNVCMYGLSIAEVSWIGMVTRASRSSKMC